ncbi:MAG: Polysaccharide deacetylase [candidate division TM6 bacterium GW2011_GWF2_37_49]|nr:MAG: Polysaccharide deacetylase [candidate division TM6 bacterium GW2011_GWF2_37_49]
MIFRQNGSVVISILGLVALTLTAMTWIAIPNSPQLFGQAVHRVKTPEKIVALTFDDGPNPPFTEQILNVLKKHQVKATFFVVGERTTQYPETVKLTYQSGHEIGNHTLSHHVLVGKSKKFIISEIDSTDALIRELGYTGPIHFRSPKGMKFVTLSQTLAHKGRLNVLFDVVGWDWSRPGIKKIVKNVMKSVRHGSIILLHDGDGDHNDKITDRSQTVQATNIIIQRLKDQGYKFVTISELLKMGKIR